MTTTLEPAPLSEALLVVKGAAAPMGPRPTLEQPRRASHDKRPRVSMRLDPGQHLRLRLAAAHLRKSVHAVVLEAVEQYLARGVVGVIDPACQCLRGPAPEGVIMPFRAP